MVAAAAALLVAGASLLSLLLYLPAQALARTLPPSRPDLRARLYLTTLLTPVLLSLALAAWVLTRLVLHPLFSPHADRLRPHLCLLTLLDTPDGPFRARLLALACAALALAAVAVAVGGMVAAAWHGRTLARKGRRQEAPPWAPGVALWETEGGLASSRGLRPTVAVGRSLGKLFTGAEADAILAHEVAHARRRDALIGPLAAALTLLQGLSPAAWVLHYRWRQEREAVCDRYAAQQTSPEAIRAALATAQTLAGALEETSPLSPADRHTLTRLTWRLQRLEGDQAKASSTWVPTIPAALGLALAASIILLPPLRDSLHCAAQALLGALGR